MFYYPRITNGGFRKCQSIQFDSSYKLIDKYLLVLHFFSQVVFILYRNISAPHLRGLIYTKWQQRRQQDYNNNNITYIALIRMRSKRFTSIVLQYDLEI